MFCSRNVCCEGGDDDVEGVCE